MGNITLKTVQTAQTITVRIDDQSCVSDRNGMLQQFWMCVGQDASGEDLWVPYILSEQSTHHFSMLNAIWDVWSVISRTEQGRMVGANRASAMEHGPRQMMIAAREGAMRGFYIGVAWAVGTELARYAITQYLSHKKYYYVSEFYQLSFHGPIHI